MEIVSNELDHNLILAQTVDEEPEPEFVEAELEEDTENPGMTWLIGFVMLCFTLPLTWQTEKRQLNVFKVVDDGFKNVLEM